MANLLESEPTERWNVTLLTATHLLPETNSKKQASADCFPLPHVCEWAHDRPDDEPGSQSTSFSSCSFFSSNGSISFCSSSSSGASSSPCSWWSSPHSSTFSSHFSVSQVSASAAAPGVPPSLDLTASQRACSRAAWQKATPHDNQQIPENNQSTSGLSTNKSLSLIPHFNGNLRNNLLPYVLIT